MKKSTLIILLATFILSFKSYSWSALGHRLIAQIAYDNMTKEAKRISNNYNHALDKVFRPQSFVNSAAWLDTFHGPNDKDLRKKHYVDWPFSLDGTKLSPPDQMNALTAVAEAQAVLHSNSNDFTKGFNLRILLHVVGDLHQPLHAANQFSAAHPEGDKGGNRFILGKNNVAFNLHSYWDRGGGFLKTKAYSSKQLKTKARLIEKYWPCELASMNLDPLVWASESHQLAIKKAYSLKPGQSPDKQYQQEVNQLTQQRIALAGCRIAAILNSLLIPSASEIPAKSV